MMERAFLDAMYAEPYSDFHRLVYADWLEEQDTEASKARAAMIREMVPNPTRFDERVQRDLFRKDNSPNVAIEWLHDHFADELPWMPSIGSLVYHPIGPAGREARWERGFLKEIYLFCHEWMKYGPTLASKHPLQLVVLLDCKPWKITYRRRQPIWRWMKSPYDHIPDRTQTTLLMASIPEPIYRYLDWSRAVRVNRNDRGWTTEEQARQVLIAACIEWARNASTPAPFASTYGASRP